MFDVLIASPATWGLAGAFVYAGPLLIACVYASNLSGGKCLKCVAEFFVAMLIGVIAAAAIAPLVQELLHKNSQAWLRMIAGFIGLLANRTAPLVVDYAPSAITDRLKKMFEAPTQ